MLNKELNDKVRIVSENLQFLNSELPNRYPGDTHLYSDQPYVIDKQGNYLPIYNLDKLGDNSDIFYEMINMKIRAITKILNCLLDGVLDDIENKEE